MIDRRDVLKGAVGAFTTALFTGRVRGANERVTVGHIGMGAMGSSNLGHVLKLPDVEPVAVCDVYAPALARAVATAAKGGKTVKAVRDFREILEDDAIDAVCVSTPDHWHAYMTVEACRRGKDVFVEKPASVYVEEGQKMVQAARKYNRVVQAGTMQRSGGYFRKAAEIVQSGVLGEVTFCHTWQSGAVRKQGWGRPPDGPVPEGLDWDMWLGPAPKVPFNPNRWGVGVATFPTFRYFWDYAGGAMTDWGVHLIDPVHQCFGEPMPVAISAMGDKLYVDDNVETPDTMMATFRYPAFLLTYESRTANPMPMFGHGAATSIHGSEGTLIVRRGGCYLVPNEKSSITALTFEKDAAMNEMNVPHWKDFIECIRTRARPASDIETCVRSSTACILANLSMRHRSWIDWDEANWTVKQDHIRPLLKARYRAPWKLEV
ncbi:MAG TPA: Gfo/Idh/MocA family oxidoreductase [Vicinamibacterales bacterium]|nr:Gfo/Idh/MocA family oxidoreductase [Vicinamibacterales bacterium]